MMISIYTNESYFRYRREGNYNQFISNNKITVKPLI